MAKKKKNGKRGWVPPVLPGATGVRPRPKKKSSSKKTPNKRKY